MGWLDKIIGKRGDEKTTAEVRPLEGLEGIRFGRYSDNNKSYEKTQLWYEAEQRFGEKAYAESTRLFFRYINDENESNLRLQDEGDGFRFELAQGSKSVLGTCDGRRIVAEAPIAVMDKPGVAVMRHLLEQNFSLFYSRYALDGSGRLCLVFDSDLSTASPNKLYYGLREVAKFADRQDDILLADFDALKPVNSAHMQALPPKELEVKYAYFRKWIQQTLELTEGLNADSFSGAIAYSYLTLLYRIDFLIIPEGKLMAQLEKVSSYYWARKDETPIVRRNAMMKEGIRKLLDIPFEEFSGSLYRSRSSFSITPVPSPDKLRENVSAANKDADWYQDNKHPGLALTLTEYGMMYNQFSYSMPAVLTELTLIFMAVLHDDFFRALGTKHSFYHPETKKPDKALIVTAVDACIGRWQPKYESLRWNHERVNYSSLWDFARSFSEQTVGLQLESRR
jgi:hypothetical protein